MRSRITHDYLALFAQLPQDVKDAARKQYGLWRDNPHHSSLHFKPIRGSKDVWSVRVKLGWRALGFVQGDVITWFWIGSHADYDRLLDQQ